MEMQTRTLAFTKGDSRYSIQYRNVRDLINCLVDYADDPDHNLDLMDVFILVHRLAFMHTRQIQGERAAADAVPVSTAPDAPSDIRDLSF